MQKIKKFFKELFKSKPTRWEKVEVNNQIYWRIKR